MLKRNRRFLLSLTTVLLVFAFGTALVLAGDAKDQVEKEKDDASTQSTLSGAKVGRDPGESTLSAPSREQAKALNKKSGEAIKKYPKATVKSKGGMKSLVVAPHHLNFNIGTVGPDGKLTYKGKKATAAERKKEQDCDESSRPRE